MTLDEYFHPTKVEVWTDIEFFRSEYRSMFLGLRGIISGYRILADRKAHPDKWTYSLSYFRGRAWERWEDLDAIEAQCVLYALWERRPWYTKLYNYLRSNWR